MKRLTAFLFSLLTTAVSVWAQESNSRADISKDVIYVVEKNPKNNKIRLGFIHDSDSVKYFVSAKIIRDEAFSYIKIAGENYYLNFDAPPSLLEDICAEFRNIKLDTSFKLGEPMSKSISIVLLVSGSGEIINLGIARGSGDRYYDDKTLQVLKNYRNTAIEPAKLYGKNVSYLLRISFNFYDENCVVIKK